LFRVKYTPGIKEIVINDELNLTPELVNNIISTLSWKQKPHLLHEGRSLHLSLERLELPHITYNGISSGCLKLKGAGRVYRDGDSLKAEAPSGKHYFGQKINDNSLAIVIHAGTDSDGRIFPVLSDVKPMGGLEFISAKNEYEITKEALAHGVSVSVPIAYGKYDISFKDKPLGFVVLGARDSLDRRLGDLFAADFKLSENSAQIRLSNYLYEFVNSRCQSFEVQQIAQLLNDALTNKGENLIAYHNAGFARHAGHDGNYQVDERTSENVLLDLDSSVRLNAIPASSVFLTRMLDVMSGLRGIHETECMNGVRHFLSHGKRSNPYFCFLKGYFNGLDRKKYNKDIIHAVEILSNQFTDPYIGSDVDEYSKIRNTFTVVALPVIFGLMKESLKREGVYPPYDIAQLKTELGGYVSEFREICLRLEQREGNIFHEALLRYAGITPN